MRGQPTAEEMNAAGLSPEEIAALSPGDDENEDILNGIAGDDDDDDGDDDGDDAGDKPADKPADTPAADGDKPAADAPAGDDKPADGDKPADSGDKPAAAATVDDDIPVVHFVPRLTGEIDAETQAKIDALDQKLEDGEMDAKAHRVEVRKLEAESQNNQIQGQLWAAEQATFFKHNKDFSAEKNPVVWGALNQEVIRLAGAPEGAGKSGIELLYLARNNVKTALAAVFGITAPAKTETPVPGSDGKPVIPAKPKSDKQGPQTLASVPAADSADVSGDKFASLDKLEGMELERALAKMSAADQEAYISGAY